MCVSKVQHVTERKTGCNRSRPVFFGFSIFRQTSQLATEKIQNLCNRNRWSGLFRLGSVRFRSFFQSSELDLRTLQTLKFFGCQLQHLLKNCKTEKKTVLDWLQLGFCPSCIGPYLHTYLFNFRSLNHKKRSRIG